MPSFDPEKDPWLQQAVRRLQSGELLRDVPFPKLLELTRVSGSLGMELNAEQEGETFTVRRDSQQGFPARPDGSVETDGEAAE